MSSFKSFKNILCLVGLGLCVLSLSACSGLGVKPWERGTLAREDMIFSDSVTSTIDNHIYFSKEASTGGSGSSGGGCGCN